MSVRPAGLRNSFCNKNIYLSVFRVMASPLRDWQQCLHSKPWLCWLWFLVGCEKQRPQRSGMDNRGLLFPSSGPTDAEKLGGGEVAGDRGSGAEGRREPQTSLMWGFVFRRPSYYFFLLGETWKHHAQIVSFSIHTGAQTHGRDSISQTLEAAAGHSQAKANATWKACCDSSCDVQHQRHTWMK